MSSLQVRRQASALNPRASLGSIQRYSMVKNRNYQVRVEESAARRKEAKDRKKRSEERRQFKAMAQECFKTLDRLVSTVLEETSKEEVSVGEDKKAPAYPLLNLHIWTDSCGFSTTEPQGDVDRNDVGGISPASTNKHAKGRARAASLGNSTDCPLSPRRARSNSVPENNTSSKKSKQKRISFDTDLDDVSENGSSSPLCCRSHFFKGRCHLVSSSSLTSSGGRKKGATCRYFHHRQEAFENDLESSFGSHSSLYQVTMPPQCNRKRNRSDSDCREQDLFLSNQAAAASLQDLLGESDPDAMEMVYYHQVPINTVEANCISTQAFGFIQKHDLNLSNIVYLCVGNELVYDRNRQGWLKSSSQEEQDSVEWLWLAVGNDTDVCSSTMRRKESIGSEYSHDDLRDIALKLPGIVLEHILTFLPDLAVTTLSSVCRAWNGEIGQNSPNLWKHLLGRHKWPLSNLERKDTTAYRDAFVSHYTVVRNVRAIKSAFYAIKSKKQGEETEMTFQDFSSREHAPSSDGNSFAMLRVWSSNRVLAAYRCDSSLRLFESGPSNRGKNLNGDSSSLVCRELVCHRLPSRVGRLEGMDLDEKYIVRLYSETDSEFYTQKFFLAVLSREAFLEGSESGVMSTTTNEQQAQCRYMDLAYPVLDFMCSNPEVMDCDFDQEFDDFCNDNCSVRGETVFVSQSIACLGNGLVLLDVTVSSPEELDDDVFSYRKNVIFSVETKAVVWVGNGLPDSLAVNQLSHLEDDQASIFCFPGPRQDEKENSFYSVALASPKSPSIVQVGEMGCDGKSLDMKTIDISQFKVEDGIQAQLVGYDRSANFWAIARTASDVIFVNAWKKQNGTNSFLGWKTVVSFLSLGPSSDGCNYSTQVLNGILVPREIAVSGQNHALILCHEFSSAPDSGNHQILNYIVVVMDISSRQEIHREYWLQRVPLSFMPSPTLTPLCSNGIVAAGMQGIVMTGENVRASCERLDASLGGSDVGSPRSLKKKKKNKVARSTKKDGFVRGKRMYC